MADLSSWRNLAGGVRDLFRDLLQRALQELIEAESTEAIGVERYERSQTRANRRNGGPRVSSTPARLLPAPH